MKLENPKEMMILNVVAKVELLFPAAPHTNTGVTGVRTCLPMTGQNQYTILDINREPLFRRQIPWRGIE
jgi:hypothetical protein